MFIKYEKIKPLHSEEVEGILIGKCYIQEKIDGANAQIWLENGEIKCGSRRNVLESGFNGFVDYVKAHRGIAELLEANPELTLYGEWLVPHTIKYNEDSYGHFYLFDMYSRTFQSFLSQDLVKKFAEIWEIKYANVFAVIDNPSMEQIQELAKLCTLGNKSEGVVIKNYEFINKFGDKMYAKYVNQNFKEDNAIVFGGNNKHSDTYKEMWAVNKYMTLNRILKVVQKVSAMKDKKLGIEDTAQVINIAYHDMFEECMWDIAKKFQEINFKSLQHLATRKASKLYRDYLEGHLSVAYNQE